jgi:tripartite ATP-independent transporter DctM subunit
VSPLIALDALLLTVLLVIGVPVPLCFAGAVIVLMTFGDYGTPAFLIGTGYAKVSSLVVVAIPLYILAGGLMSHGGIAQRLVAVADTLFGRTRLGLGGVVIFTTAVFGAISGMASSAVAAVGTIMVPRMVERGYDRNYASTLVAVSAVLALLIPPSASMILFGWVTGTSILACFLAPIIPAMILIVLFGFWNIVLTRNMPILRPAPAPLRKVAVEFVGRVRHATLALLMPVVILGFIYGGVTTPTEAAAVAVIYAIPVSLWVYRDMNWRDLGDVFWRAGQITGVLLLMIFFASMLARIWTMEDVPQHMLSVFLSVSEDPIVLLLMANFFLVIIGMFMDDASGILLASPLLMPLMLQVGVDPIQFAAIIAVNLGMGLITPPTAPILYFGALIGKAQVGYMMKPALVFVLGAYLPVVLLVTFIPELSLTLPRWVLGLN